MQTVADAATVGDEHNPEPSVLRIDLALSTHGLEDGFELRQRLLKRSQERGPTLPHSSRWRR